MDYSQKGQTGDVIDFFTAGVGNVPADQNTYQSENNLDLTNNQTSWDMNKEMQPSVENTRNIGNRAILSSEKAAQTEMIHDNQLLDELVESVVSHDVPVAPTTIPDEMIEKISFDASLIKTDGDHIDPRAIKEADHVISILGETRDACSFEEAIRGENGMVRKNVTNSYKDNPYNRKAA
jgi:hypothetical protein